MLNSLYIDYKIDTKSEITPTEQVAINLKESAVEAIEQTIENGGTTLTQVNDKKKKLDDAKETAIEESTAWKAEEILLSRMQNKV